MTFYFVNAHGHECGQEFVAAGAATSMLSTKKLLAHLFMNTIITLIKSRRTLVINRSI